MTLWCGPSVLNSTPRSLISRTTLVASSASGSNVIRSRTNSNPMNKPLPLTSPIAGYVSFSFRRPFKKYSPYSLACSCNYSSSITSRTALPIAQDTGLPPVELNHSISPREDAISFVVNTAAIGWPFPIDLPRTTISGTTS